MMCGKNEGSGKGAECEQVRVKDEWEMGEEGGVGNMVRIVGVINIYVISVY